MFFFGQYYVLPSDDWEIGGEKVRDPLFGPFDDDYNIGKYGVNGTAGFNSSWTMGRGSQVMTCPNLAMCWAQRRPPATTAPSESPDESDLESELHIDLDRGCSATPDPPEPGTPPIDGGAISKSAFNSGRAAGMRVSPSCMNSLW